MDKVKTPLRLTVNATTLEVQVVLKHIERDGTEVEMSSLQSNILHLGGVST